MRSQRPEKSTRPPLLFRQRLVRERLCEQSPQLHISLRSRILWPICVPNWERPGLADEFRVRSGEVADAGVQDSGYGGDFSLEGLGEGLCVAALLADEDSGSVGLGFGVEDALCGGEGDGHGFF